MCYNLFKSHVYYSKPGQGAQPGRWLQFDEDFKAGIRHSASHRRLSGLRGGLVPPRKHCGGADPGGGPADALPRGDAAGAARAHRRRGPDGKININTADSETLQTLPGIGEKRAADIVADREANGPFRIAEDLTRVKGIGESILAGLLEQITVE